MTAEIISSLLMLVGGITILTNIIVQVVKSITWDKIPTNLVALFVSEALTLALGGAYASVKGIDIRLVHGGGRHRGGADVRLCGHVRLR